ncbi:ATP-dependent DNA helicase DinG [Rosenbergiella collisarenosi]|uniref:ATP-dependent DNA helicase DinG n=1 Tax=Rosenbergiella collisarenosi TaxID=1544695 RepID=UPI001BD92903|nr:ATP-dependent DNA helicase DinG [Rosenbergiella collisarenosi]MBT0722463.1 ATP-dependent DNA helicase DinG [Rosenbergiella collisarenosi]
MSSKSDSVSAIIERSYTTFLSSKGLKKRDGQVSMMNACYQLINDITVDKNNLRSSPPAVAVIEAGTGTGKTVAYSLPLISLAKEKKKSLIIATATVALQEQIIIKDFPDIRKNSGLDFTYDIAKGKGRYFCKLRADKDSERSMSLFGFQDASVDILLQHFDNKSWNGDKDYYPSHIDEDVWQRVNAKSGQCLNQDCPYYDNCPFFKARSELDNVDVIITNHDMLFSDLSLGGGVILPSPSESIYVFDEGHHLTEKALSHFSRSCSVDSMLKLSTEVIDMCIPLVEAYDDNVLVKVNRLNNSVADLKKESEFLKDFMLKNIGFTTRHENKGTTVFPKGKPPAELVNNILPVKLSLKAILKIIAELNELIDKAENSEKAEHKLITSELENRYSDYLRAWTLFSEVSDKEQKEMPIARWIDVLQDSKNEVIINASPIHAAETLHTHIWKQAFASVITSATLRTMGNFDSYLALSGLTGIAKTLHARSPFNYHENGVLFIPKMKYDPTNVEGHTQEIGAMIPKLAFRLKGCLVLFTSKKQMHEVFDMMPEDLKENVLVQSMYPKNEIINRHKNRIDSGQQSVIFGLSSFSEGVDLPGDYCNNVIISKLPFMVPTDPVSATLTEWMKSVNRNTFTEISVPNACIKLIQSVGRLIRTETDKGAVTILDTRLLSKYYGTGMIDTLPSFKRVFR